MRNQSVVRLLLIILCVFPACIAQAQATAPPPKRQSAAAVHPAVAPKVCARCIRAHEEFLASDAMQGRGSGTHDELVTATYLGSELRQYGIEPAGDDGSYIQRVPTIQRKIISPPQLTITPQGSPIEPLTWEYGREFITTFLMQTQFSGRLRKLDVDRVGALENTKIEPGSVVLIISSDPGKGRAAAFSLASAGPAAMLMLTGEGEIKSFEKVRRQLPQMPDRLEQESVGDMNINVLELSQAAFDALKQMPEGARVRFDAPSSDKKGFTWNAVGTLRGTDASLQHAAILFSAHLDHLGIGAEVKGDNIYNGADDDASGTTAVLEIARVLGQGRRPRRTVIFALFGSEEMGGLGSSYFREHPPLPLKDIAANLEFEMMGRPDPAVKKGTLWLTGWERSNFGLALVAHGARLVRDPHPREDFFSRSDNFVLAKKGVVAQTLSSYGLHADYHKPSDDLAHLDFAHLDATIGSLLAPIEWLVNSSFRPKWNLGGQP